MSLIPPINPENAAQLYAELFGSTYTIMQGLYSLSLSETPEEQDEKFEKLDEKTTRIANTILDSIRKDVGEDAKMTAFEFMQLAFNGAAKKLRRTTLHPMIVAVVMLKLGYGVNHNLTVKEPASEPETRKDEGATDLQN